MKIKVSLKIGKILWLFIKLDKSKIEKIYLIRKGEFMKKYIIILCMFLGLCGCGKSDNVVKKFQNKIEKADNYILKGNMSIVSNEDTFTYKVEASKSKEGYYKVSLINQTNNHEQVILKNKDGMYINESIRKNKK